MKKGLRLGDRWLLAIFALLIAQSVYGLFYPLPMESQVESIDIVFRTSEAAIFGYIISSNFGRRKAKVATVQSDAETPQSIGFDTQEGPVASALGKRTTTPEVTAVSIKEKKTSGLKKANLHQLTLVGIIGIVSLLVLIVWRNVYGRTGAATTGMIAVITQYRDMVSGCVGFLIGYPQSTQEGDG